MSKIINENKLIPSQDSVAEKLGVPQNAPIPENSALEELHTGPGANLGGIDAMIPFKVPIWNYYYFDSSEINKKAANYIQDLKAQNKGVQNSNRNGWQSEQFLFSPAEKPPDDIKKILDFIGWCVSKVYNDSTSGAGGMHITYWFNINSYGSRNIEHNHPGSMFSGTYYITVPKGQCGHLVLINPSISTHQGYYQSHYRTKIPGEQDQLAIEARPGAAWLFRSYLKHEVTTNFTNEDRISIAFNAGLTNLAL